MADLRSSSSVLTSYLLATEAWLARATRWHLAVPVVFSVFAFIGIAHPLQNLNEGLYARIPQEMLESGNWIIPTLNGVPYLEKPPLMYWLSAAGYGAFGVSEWAARLPCVLGFVAMIWAVFWFASRHASRTAAIAAVAILCSCPLSVIMSRTLLFDSLLSGLFAWCIVALYEALTTRSRAWMRACYALLALAILAKGLAALVFFLFVAAAAAFVVFPRRAVPLPLFVDRTAVVLFLAIALPWHVAAAMQQDGFAWFYFVNEHVMRFLGRRVPHDYHTGGAAFYLPRMALYTLPWMVLFVPLHSRGKPDKAPVRAFRRFLLLWIAVPLAIFSASVAKGDYYMLIAMPALALYLASRLEELEGHPFLAALPAVTVALTVGISMYAQSFPAPSVPGEIYAALGCTLLLALLAWWSLHEKKLQPAAFFLGAVCVPIGLLFSSAFETNEPAKSGKTIALELSRLQLPAFLYKDFEQLSAVAFYSRAPLGVVASESQDLWWGLRLQRDPARYPDAQQFDGALQWKAAAVVVRPERLAEFEASPFRHRCELRSTVEAASLFVCGPPR